MHHPSCSSQEEHVLKLMLYIIYIDQQSCSSQEEHVLKQAKFLLDNAPESCSSQEEHVLKRILVQEEYEKILLLLARGACIETYAIIYAFSRNGVAPRKRSMY